MSSLSVPSTTTPVPEPVERLARVMAGYTAPWALCGGWALDAWLGSLSREHGDVDLSVFDADHQRLFDHLDGWQLIAHDSSHDDASIGLWDGRPLRFPSHIHARAPEDAGPLPEDGVCSPAAGWWLDIQIDHRASDEWVLSAEPRIALPLADAVSVSPWGVPVAAPEALLYFKSREPRRRDWRDFVALLPHLDHDQRNWLAEAIAATDAGHPWIAALRWANSVARGGPA